MRASGDFMGDLALPSEDYWLEVVSFRSGDLRMAVQSCQVHRLLALRETRPLSDVVSIEALLGLPTADEKTTTENGAGEASRRQLLIGTGDLCVEVTGPAELDSIPAEEIFGLPTLVVAGCALRGLQAIALDDAGLILIVDLLSALDARPDEPISA